MEMNTQLVNRVELVIGALTSKQVCPLDFGLEIDCDDNDQCSNCWAKVFEKEQPA